MSFRDIPNKFRQANDGNFDFTDGTSGSPLSDTKDLKAKPVGLIIHAAGAVKLRDMGDRDTAFPALAVGVMHPIRFKRLWSTGTAVAAANITVVYSDQ